MINVGLKRPKFSKNKCNRETVINTPFSYHVSFSSYENNIVKTTFLPDVLVIFSYFGRINLISQKNLILEKSFNRKR